MKRTPLVETPIPVGDEDALACHGPVGVLHVVETPIPVGDEDAPWNMSMMSSADPELRLPSPSVTRTHSSPDSIRSRPSSPLRLPSPSVTRTHQCPRP